MSSTASLSSPVHFYAADKINQWSLSVVLGGGDTHILVFSSFNSQVECLLVHQRGILNRSQKNLPCWVQLPSYCLGNPVWLLTQLEAALSHQRGRKGLVCKADLHFLSHHCLSMVDHLCLASWDFLIFFLELEIRTSIPGISVCLFY